VCALKFALRAFRAAVSALSSVASSASGSSSWVSGAVRSGTLEAVRIWIAEPAAWRSAGICWELSVQSGMALCRGNCTLLASPRVFMLSAREGGALARGAAASSVVSMMSWRLRFRPWLRSSVWSLDWTLSGRLVGVKVKGRLRPSKLCLARECNPNTRGSEGWRATPTVRARSVWRARVRLCGNYSRSSRLLALGSTFTHPSRDHTTSQHPHPTCTIHEQHGRVCSIASTHSGRKQMVKRGGFG
jgi:hypothetical protein